MINYELHTNSSGKLILIEPPHSILKYQSVLFFSNETTNQKEESNHFKLETNLNILKMSLSYID